MSFNYRVAVEVIMQHEGKILLVKRAKNLPIAPDVWNVPAAKIGLTETPSHVVVRECLKETNVKVKIIKPLCDRAFKTKYNGHDAYRLVFTYLCEPENGIENFRLNEDHSTHEWISPEDVMKPEYDTVMHELRMTINELSKG